jgi:FlaG/FlaF family flagellin (archaellin)
MLILAVAVAVVLAAGAMLWTGGFGGGSAQAEPLPKVLVLHNTGSETNPFEIICISENALDAHVNEHIDVPLGPCGTEGPLPE